MNITEYSKYDVASAGFAMFFVTYRSDIDHGMQKGVTASPLLESGFYLPGAGPCLIESARSIRGRNACFAALFYTLMLPL